MDTTLTKPWWRLEGDERADAVYRQVKSLDTNQSYRQQDNVRYLRLYNNQDNVGLMLNLLYRSTNQNQYDFKVAFNVIMSVIDTVVNKIAKQKPKPTFLTIKGDYSLRRKAQLLDQFCQGLAHTTKIYDEGQRVFRDGCVFGTGFLKIYRDGKRIVAERVFPDEIQVDDQEAVYGTPRTLYQRKLIDKETLIAEFPEHEAQIAASVPPPEFRNKIDSAVDQVLVTEAWHLPSSRKSKDGRHTISIPGRELFGEVYTKDYFPFVQFKWKDRLLGFYGIGLAEELQGIQREINRLLEVVRKVFKLVTVPRVFMEFDGKTPTAQLNNEIGAVIKGKAPTFYTPPGLPPEFYAHLERLYNRAFEIAGVSALSATAKKPDGLNSGKSLREYSDIESERFVTVGQQWEAFYMEAYRQMIELAKEIKDFAVSAPSRKFIERIKWDDIQLEDDQFVMQVFPTSMLSTTPAGKLQDVQEMMQAGLINKDWGIRLLDFPDLDGFNSYVNAAFDDIQRQIERCLDGEDLSPPEPYQNLNLGIQLFQSAYLRAKDENVPEDRLELMRQWMDQAAGMLAKAQAIAQAANTPPAPAGAAAQPPQVPGTPAGGAGGAAPPVAA